MAAMKPGKDIVAFRYAVEAELKKLGVDTDKVDAINVIHEISKRAVQYAGDFHDNVMGLDH